MSDVNMTLQHKILPEKKNTLLPHFGTFELISVNTERRHNKPVFFLKA